MATITGTNRADDLHGTAEGDMITARGGADRVNGGGGGDRILGGWGNDELWGNDGGDIIDGGRGRDTIGTGGTFAPGEVDIARGRAGDDHLIAEYGESFLRGDSGNDTFEAYAPGHATLHGGTGDDRYDLVCQADWTGAGPSLPGIPTQTYDIRTGVGADQVKLWGQVDGAIAWARIEDFTPDRDLLEIAYFNPSTGEWNDVDQVFDRLDTNDDQALDTSDGPTDFGEVLVDAYGVHLRTGDDWLSLKGHESLMASDFDLTGVA
jgi:Ca2+-binding RTX toxin-like protein